MKKPIKELVTRVNRTYRGGKMLDAYVGNEQGVDTFQPEDWISSFVEAKNRVYIENEGLTRVMWNGEERLLCDVVSQEDFGQGRKDAGVLIKFLDAAERLGIQVHPTKEYARKVFDSAYGKTECWHFLGSRMINGEPPCIYMGFKEHVTKELWKKYFDEQDIPGMLSAMHRIEVKEGDTVLVTGGTPHAIGPGCFMLEIQEPSDYTMRTEKVTLAGQVCTPNQIHYGVGEEKMLECFEYIPMSEQAIRDAFFLPPRKDGSVPGLTHLVTYEDTPCFRLDRVIGPYAHQSPEFVTLIITGECGILSYDGKEERVFRGEKYFIPANTSFTLSAGEGLICYPPKLL
ncbi:MAG: mannose-6-phosphate isomerase [Clostridiales bacterium]|nr:mannose-6-phosphate isomerase [Clostridiales bacterium]